MKEYGRQHYKVLVESSHAPEPGGKLKNILKIFFGKGLVRHYSGDGPSGVFLQNTRLWEYPWALEQLDQLPAGARILDCGCGVSLFPLELFCQGYKPTGLDAFLQEDLVSLVFGRYAGRIYLKFLGRDTHWGIPRRLRRRFKGRVEYVDGSMSRIPLPDESFDAVTCLSVMEHVVLGTIDDPSYHLRCLDEMKRVLKPGGLLVCTYDTVLEDSKRFGVGMEGWGNTGWHYLADIDYLGMDFRDPDTKRVEKREISMDTDAYIVPPEAYYDGYGRKQYERITSVGRFCFGKAVSRVVTSNRQRGRSG